LSVTARPWVAVVADCVQSDGRQEQRVAEKYLEPLRHLAQADILLLPSTVDGIDVDAVLSRCDGVMLTGALSNVHPQAYGEADATAREPLDPARDAVALPLIAAAAQRGLPLLGICRGLQELNVACGGSLHPALHELPGRHDHRAPAAAGAARYQDVHEVFFTAAGMLEAWAGARSCRVNSLHGQGIDRLGEGLLVEAVAADDTIEAVRVDGHPFALAVQWHLEWQADRNPLARSIYQAFGMSLRGGRKT
jgi:putative glutamine amidotransferase